MAAKLIDIKVEQGANFSTVFTIPTGEPADLTGYVGFMQARTHPEGEVLADFTVTVDTVARTATSTLAAAASIAMTWNNGVYDLIIVNAPNTYRIAYGNITLSKRITIAP